MHRIILAIVALVALASAVEVRKVVRAVEGLSNTFAVDVEYRVTLAGTHDVGVLDSLPEEMSLVSGSLVARVPKVKGSAEAVHKLSYVTAASGAEFTMANMTRRIALPAARVSVFGEGDDEVVLESALSNPVTVVAHLKIPRGWLFEGAPAPLVTAAVAFFTIAFPAIAAFFLIKKFTA